MATVFWDRKEVLKVEFMQHGTTVTLEMYCGTLNKRRRDIQNKRPGMLTYSMTMRFSIQLLALEHC
jgi:hypothetical protein